MHVFMKRLAQVGGGVAVALAMVALLGFGAAEAGASTAATATPAVGGPCSVYTPTALTISVPSATPGTSVTIAGKGYHGSHVTISISGTGYTSRQLGTATVGPLPTSSFSIAVNIPTDILPGSYTITVTNPSCIAPGTITIVVPANTTVSCASNPTVLQRGQSVTWKLFTIFDKNQSTSLDLIAQFLYPYVPASVLFSAHYPASGSVTFVVPGAAADGYYNITEVGLLPTGSPWTQSCAIRVSGAVPAVVTTTTTKPVTTTTTTPVKALAAKLVSFNSRAQSLSSGSGSSQSSQDGRLALVAALAVFACGGLISIRSNRRHRRA
jgi:hypothetical protein